MGKHTKTPAGITSGPALRNPDGSLKGLSDAELAASAPSPLADIESGLREAFDAARTMVQKGDAPVQVLRELGGLGRAITTVQAERRAQAKAREYTAKNIPREVIMEALRAMKTDERAHVRRELDAMDNTESVLG